MKIIFEDNDIVVCVKPKGVVSQFDESKPNMISLLSEQTGGEIYPVHRLDRETEGVMVYAKNKKAAAGLSSAVTENKLEKRYLAVLKGIPEKQEDVLEDLLFRDRQKNKTYVVKRIRKGVREASLEYRIRGTADGLSLADILLHTGRTHQIRVQFASRNLPLSGDSVYGGGSGSLALFAYSLSFPHPSTKETMSFRALPDSTAYPWNLFGDCL